MEHEQSGDAMPTEARAMAHCIDCGRTWLLMVSMLLVREDAKAIEAKQRAQKREEELAEV